MALTDKLGAIGAAIRSKTGKTDLLTLEEMPAEIEGIMSGASGDIDTFLSAIEGIEPFSISAADIYGITALRECAFMYCDNITAIDIPATVTTLGNRIFMQCTNLESITIPSSVKQISQNLCYGCSSLVSVVLSPSAHTIADSAFRDCTSLVSIEIPASVMSIGGYAFNGCSSLKTIKVLRETPPTISSNSFPSVNYLEKIIVPAGCASAYKEKWSNYASIITEV